MKKDFETNFAGWLFVVAAILLWGSWALTTHHIGEYIVASDFEVIGEDVWYWIWMYRFHIFGWVTMAMAMMSFLSFTAKKPMRSVTLPGVGMVVVGTFTLAIAAAYFYNFGAWGVGKTIGKSPEDIQQFMDGILFTNQYVTCFIRFGRIFSGVGMVLLGYAFLKWKLFSPWLGWFTAILGVAAVGIILAISDNFDIYKPIFHLKVLWLILMGVTLLKQGVRLEEG